MTRISGNILNVITYNTGDFLASTVAPGATELPLTFAFDFNEAGGEAQMASNDQVVLYTGFDPDTQVLHLDATTPISASAFEGDKVDVLPYSSEKRAFVEIAEDQEPINVRVPHNLQAVLEDGIRSESSGYESVSIESDGSEWVLKEIYGKPAKITVDALPPIPADLMADGIAPVASPAVTVSPLGVGSLQGRWTAATQPDLHDPIIYDVYVSATTPVVADAEHFLTSTAGTSQAFSRVPVGGVWVPISMTEPSYMAVWARDADGLAPTLGGEGSSAPRKADIEELNVTQLNAKTIETLAVWAANVNADFVFANNKIVIGDETGSHILIDPAVGLKLFGTDGTTPVVTLDMTAAQLSEFTGKINTSKLAVFESVEIHGLFSKIMSAAYLTIASSTISAPSSPPTLTQSTNTMTWPALPAGFAEFGLYWETNKWRRLLYNASTYETRVEHISSVGASVSSVTLANEATDRDARGIVADGTYFYCIRRDNAAAGSANFNLKKYYYNGSVVPNTGAASTYVWDSVIGYSSPVDGSDVQAARIDSSNVIHVLDDFQQKIRRFSTSGVYAGQTAVPDGLALTDFDVDASGNYYGISFAHNTATKFNSAGVITFQFGSYGAGNGQFNGPAGIRLDGSGNIYVVDTYNHRIQKFNSSGVYQSQFGAPGAGNGQFSAPYGLNFDASGNIYVVDTGNNRVQKFNSSGVYQSQFGGSGSGSGLFSSPVDIDFDSSGNIYVADESNYLVQKFNSSGVYQSEFGYYEHNEGVGTVLLDTSDNVYTFDTDDNGNLILKFDSSGTNVDDFPADGGTSGDGGMSGPLTFARDASGNFFVVDNDYDRIKKFNSAGVWQADYGTKGTGNGQFDSPIGIAIDTAGSIYVSDSGNNRIQKFNSSMTYQSQWGSYGSGNGQFINPQCLATDSSNNVYVVDVGNNRIQKFNSSGTYQTKWGSLGTANGQFTTPTGIAVDSGNNVYVAESGNDRVQKFTNTGTYVSKTGSLGSSTAQFDLPRGIGVDAGDNIYIADTNNSRIKKYNSSLVYQSSISSGYSGLDQWGNPSDVKVDGSGNVYILDSFVDRMFKYVGAFPAMSEPVANEISAVNRTYPALGYDGTDLLVGAVDNTSMDIDNISAGCGLVKYNKSNLTFTGTYYKFTGDIVANTSTSYVGLSNFDYSGSRVLLGSLTTMRAYTYSGTTLTADTTHPSWTYDGSAKASAWDGTTFYSVADTTVIRRYSGFLATSPAQRKFWAQYQWENGATQGTTPSPKQSFDLLDRRWLNITFPTPGAGTGYTRIFTGNGTSSPANSAMYSLGAPVATTGGTVQTSLVLTSGTNPKTVADLPSGAAGIFEAEEGSFSVNGNSIGRWDEKGATPRFYGERTTDQTAIVTSTETTVLWTENASLSKDTAADYWSYNSGTGVVTVNKTGWWRYDARIRWDSSGTGTGRRMFVFQNATKIAQHEGTVISTARSIHNVLSGWWYFTAGDTVQVKGWHDRGSNSLIDADANGVCAFMLAYEGPS